MKRKNFRESLIILCVLLFAFAGITFGRDLEESKYNKNFVVKQSRVINITKSTSGKIVYSLGRGTYMIEIYSLDKESTMHLDDGILDIKFSDEKFVEHAITPIEIKEGYYKFKVVNKINAKYKHFYKTTINSGKLYIKITKIK